MLVGLNSRSLLPALTGGVWYVSGSSATPGDAVTVTAVFVGQVANNGAPSNAVAVTYAAPSGSIPADIWNAVVDDANTIKNGPQVDTSPACATAPPTIPSTGITVCFYL
jgi:hypothetical protein